MGTMWNYWTEGKGKSRKVRRARSGRGTESVGGMHLSDMIPGRYGMGKKEFDYRVDDGKAIWNLKVPGGGKPNLPKNRIDRRVCHGHGKHCDRCGHAADCRQECGHLSHRKKWTW